MIIYFSIGVTNFLVYFIFFNLKNSFGRLIFFVFALIILWPIFLFNSIRLFFLIGRYLTPRGRWQLFFPTKKTTKEKSDNDYVSSEIRNFFGDNQPPF